MKDRISHTTGPAPARWRSAVALVLLGGMALAGCAESAEPLADSSGVTAANYAGPSTPAPRGAVRFVSASGKYLAGRHARRERDFASAAQFLSDALAIDKHNRRIRRQAFFALVASGHLKQAATAARAVVAENKGAAIANLAIVVDDMATGRFKQASDRLASMPKRGMNTFTAPLLLAWAEAGQGNEKDAVGALDGLKNVASFAALRNLHIGLIHAILGHADEAEAALKAAAQSSRSMRVVQGYGRFLERAGRIAEAKHLYDTFLAKNPDTDMIEAAEARAEAGRKPPLLVSDAKEGAAEVFFNLASTLSQGRSTDLALIYTRFALYLRPDFPIAQILLGGLLEGLNRGNEAVATYDAVRRTSPLYWAARLRKAAALDDLNRDDEAIAELRKMAVERPKDPDAPIRLGDLLRGKERFEDAIAAYSEAIKRIGKLEKRHWSLLYARGIAYERAKHWPQAEADFLHALKLSPEQPYVLNYLGYSWVDKGIHLAKAKAMIRRAVELRPNDGYIVDSLGWVLYRLGDYRGAAEHLERAVVLRPEDATINDHLGDAYWRVGRSLEARFQWRRALSLDPEKSMIPEIEKKLHQGLAVQHDKDENG